MWMVARQAPEDPGALVLATKGGHNGELHNQNDVGNVIVHVETESVISDIGRGRYTKAYFGPERYEHIAKLQGTLCSRSQRPGATAWRRTRRTTTRTPGRRPRRSAAFELREPPARG